MKTATPLRTRPSLAYQYALDLCASRAYSRRPSLAVVTSPALQNEMQDRLGRDVPILTVDRFVGDSSDWDASLECTVLMEGDARNLPVLLPFAYQRLIPGGHLYLLAPTLFARLLAKQGGLAAPSNRLRPIGLLRCRALLMKHGFAVTDTWGFATPASVAWMLLSRLFASCRMPYWEDRCWLQSRRSYHARGQSAALSPLIVLEAIRQTG